VVFGDGDRDIGRWRLDESVSAGHLSRMRDGYVGAEQILIDRDHDKDEEMSQIIFKSHKLRKTLFIHSIHTTSLADITHLVLFPRASIIHRNNRPKMKQVGAGESQSANTCSCLSSSCPKRKSE
jgi:hypothetical protein